MGLKLSNKEQKRSYFILTGTLKKKLSRKTDRKTLFLRTEYLKFREKIAGNW